MLIAFSFFCCCLILLWFCIVVLLAVLFCLTLLLLVLPFSEIFAFVLFCFFNFDVISQPYFHKLFSVFWVLFCFVIFCYYFFILLLFHNLTCFLGMSGREKTYKPPVTVFFKLDFTWPDLVVLC